MKIKFDATDDFLRYVIVEAASSEADRQKKPLEDVIPRLGEDLDVVFTINGVECPLEPTFDHIYNQLEQMSEKRAIEILDDNFEQHKTFVERLQKKIRIDVKKKLGIDIDENDWL